jgi:hypothetical protein
MLTQTDLFGMRSVNEHVRIGEIVVEHDVCLKETLLPAQV